MDVSQDVLYTPKQRKLLEELDAVISKEGIDLKINPWGELVPSLPVSLDIEHDEQGNMVGIGICKGKRCWYFTTLNIGFINQLKLGQYICHNGVSDFECLRHWGINIKEEQLYWDTMLIGHIIDSSQRDYSLKGIAKRELGIQYPSYDDIVGKRGLKAERITLDKQPRELVAKYNACDTYATYKIWERQKGYV